MINETGNSGDLSLLLPQLQLEEMLETLHACVGLPVEYLNGQGEIVKRCGENCLYCRHLRRDVFAPGFCSRMHLDAARRADQLGEPYIFTCDSRLNHIVFPLAGKTCLYGAILAGPFLMDKPDSTLLNELNEKYAVNLTQALGLYDELTDVCVISPRKTSYASRLIYYMFSPLIPENRYRMDMRRGKLLQQARISETLQRFKEQGAPVSLTYTYQMEKDLIARVRTGNVHEAKKTLNELLGHVLFAEGGETTIMKSRALELCALLSRVAIEQGATTELTLRMVDDFYNSVNGCESFEELCSELQSVVEAFMENMFSIGSDAGHEYIRQALDYIAANYSTPLTLNEVAREVHLTPTYFSTVFNECMHLSFREHLNRLRVEESKRLLRYSDSPIVEIAISVGFNDQSYFCKVFRRYAGCSPKKWRMNPDAQTL